MQTLKLILVTQTADYHGERCYPYSAECSDVLTIIASTNHTVSIFDTFTLLLKYKVLD